MTKSNDVTGDRITNALKGDKEAYRNNWERIFGKPKPIPKDYFDEAEELTRDVEIDYDEEILDEITQMNEDMGLYDE